MVIETRSEVENDIVIDICVERGCDKGRELQVWVESLNLNYKPWKEEF